MNVLITAGGIPGPGEYLFEESEGKPKAMLDILGKPMIQWILDVLDRVERIEEIFIVGLSAEEGLHSGKPLHFIPDQQGMLENVLAGTAEVVRHHPRTDLFLMISSDIPALTTLMVDWTLDQALGKDVDIHYFTIHRQDMEARYPTSHRTYTRFRDGAICSADLFLVRASKVLNPDARWRELLSARKNPLKQAAIIGFDTLFLMVLRILTLQQAVRILEKRLDLSANVAFTPYPEMGMDVDKSFQLEIIRQDLARDIS
jgi:GTP:adenosylcobinamide-phosphate guanylyltransferase